MSIYVPHPLVFSHYLSCIYLFHFRIICLFKYLSFFPFHTRSVLPFLLSFFPSFLLHHFLSFLSSFFFPFWILFIVPNFRTAISVELYRYLSTLQPSDLTYCYNQIREPYCRIWSCWYRSTLHCRERKSRTTPRGYSNP